MAGSSPTGVFLVTVDTEGDNLWAKPRAITTRNAAFIPRFQELCGAFGLKPTYLTNWEMACAGDYVEFAKDVLARGAGEVGMHLHAWNSPPEYALTADDDAHAPYLIEYPPRVIRDKVRAMTDKLQEVFGRKMVSHRAGRWSFNETYAAALLELDYQVDCSVTPHVSWRFCKGDPSRQGGTDYRQFPETAYFVDPSDIRRPGRSTLLELPMTIIRTRTYAAPIELARQSLAGHFYATVALNKLFPNHLWLMPNGRNRQSMLRVLSTAISQRRPYIELAIHSSELMPGGSPTFPDEASIETLYDDLQTLFTAAAPHYRGSTLAEYRATFSSPMAVR